MTSHAFSDSNLLNYKINKRKKLTPLNQIIFNSNIGSIFHKKKRNFDNFSPSPDAEEIPAFSFENDRNIKNYKKYISNKSAFVEKNLQDYIRYIKKFEKPKQHNTLNTPYIFYQEKNNEHKNYNNNAITKNNYNLYENNVCSKFNTLNTNKECYDSLNGDNNNQSSMSYEKKLYLDANNYLNNIHLNKEKKNLKKFYFNNISKNDLNNDNNNNNETEMKNNNKILTPSLSYNEIFSIGNNEISNPSSYYKKYDEDYYRYRLEQKKYLDYNYKFMMNKDYQKHKKEPNVNPYNPKYNIFRANKSDLIHNPILNPINHYGYNKYLRKDLNNKDNDKLKQLFRNYLNSNDNNINNNNDNFINNNINSRNNNIEGIIRNQNKYKSE
jgi:hypothetical protein